VIRRLLSILHARNLEFLRDRGTLLFTTLLPLMVVVGMGFVFGGPERPLFKVGIVTAQLDKQADSFLRERYVEFIAEPDTASGLQRLTHQQIDLLADLRTPMHYWVNRKSGFLKRLHATPLTAFEFLSAQVLSRLLLILFVTVILYVGISAIIGFHNAGSFFTLALVAILSALSMVALGLTIAARFSSEELVGGLLNLLTWPMMLLSGIWFSLEGSPRWIQWIAHVFPLTHALDAARAVMLDGAGLRAIAPNLLYLAATAFAFLAFGAWSFRWRID
jgi:ABC transporter DrrB family efflux protein